MSKNKSCRLNKSDTGKDTKEARLSAAQFFVLGDHVRSRITGKTGVFTSINLGFALPEVWVVFDSDTDSSIPISCNPLDLELAQKDSKEHRLLRGLGMLGGTQLPNTWHNGSVESKEQATDETPALVDETALTPEVAEELAGSSSDHTLLSGSETTIESVRDMAATGNDTPQAAVEVVEELTPEEEAERHRLELKVERAFYEAGRALRELRDRRLYRSTHKTFEQYCQDRFEFGRISAHYKIAAAEVMENLLMIREQDDLLTNREQIFPTKLEQVRPLTTLEPDEQRQVWQQAVEKAGGKLPSGRIVKSIVERLKEKYHTPATDSYNVGDVFWVTGLSGSERKYNTCWAIARSVNDFTLEIDVHDSVLQVKPDNLNPIDEPDARRQLPQILKRIKRLRECGLLDRCAYTVLESLGRQTYLTEVEEKVLCCLEAHYAVSNAEN